MMQTEVKLAEVFGVSTNYLLVEDSPRPPFRPAEDALGDRLATVAELSSEDLTAFSSTSRSTGTRRAH